MNKIEIRDKQATLKDEAIEIINKAKSEIRELTEDELNTISKIKEQINALNQQLEEIEKEMFADSADKTNTKNKRSMNFSLIKSIRDISNNKQLDNASQAVINAGAEEMRKAGLSYGGQIQIPVAELRANEVTVQSEGEDVVETTFTNILEPLRAKNVLVKAGAKFMSGLVGDVQIPIMNPSQVGWAGEIEEAADANVTFGNVKLTPKRLTAYVDISKQFLAQDSLDAEAMIKNDLLNAINTKLESTILGTDEGTATKPAGIFNGTLTGITTFADVCTLESVVDDSNVMGECAYIVSNKAKANLRNMAKSTKSTELVMEHGEIDGTPVYNTSNVGEQFGVAYGDWSNLVIGQWGGIDLTVDPFSQATKGCVRVTVNFYVDAKVVRPNTIVAAKAEA